MTTPRRRVLRPVRLDEADGGPCNRSQLGRTRFRRDFGTLHPRSPRPVAGDDASPVWRSFFRWI